MEHLYAKLLCGADDALTALENNTPATAELVLRQLLAETEEAYLDGMAAHVGRNRRDETFLVLLDTRDKSC